MLQVGAFEAKNRLGTLLDRVLEGEEVVITRHGRAVARLVASSGAVDRTQARAAAERIQARARTLAQGGRGGFEWEALKRDRDEGRP